MRGVRPDFARRPSARDVALERPAQKGSDMKNIDPTTPMTPRNAYWLRTNGMQTREDLARNHVRLVRSPNRRAAGGGFAFLALVSVAALVLMGYATWMASR